MRQLWIVAVTIITLAGCSSAGGGVAPTASVTAAAPSGEPKSVAEGLAVPWAIALAQGGDALVTERDTARLLRVSASGQVTEVGRVDGVDAGGEGGLMGVAVKDDLVFLYFTAATDNRIVRYRLANDRLSDAQVIVEGIPKGGIHNGGRLAVGPDGFLYASTGETGERGLSQDKNSLGGKILRMTQDGKPADGNPFGTLVYSYGHRNVQGLAWDEAGRLYASEFGQNTFDEVNQIKAGGNYGWPEVEGVGRNPAYVDPIVTWDTSDASPSGMAYANGSLWVAALRGERLWQVPLASDGAAGKPVAHYTGEYGRLRSVAVAPGGALWVGTSNKDGRGSPRDGDDRILSVTSARP